MNRKLKKQLKKQITFQNNNSHRNIIIIYKYGRTLGSWISKRIQTKIRLTR